MALFALPQYNTAPNAGAGQYAAGAGRTFASQRQASQGYVTVPRRVADTARQDTYVRSARNGQQADNTTSGANGTANSGGNRAADVLAGIGLSQLATAASRIGIGTLRSGALFNYATPVQTVLSAYSATLPTTGTAVNTDELRAAANVYRQTGVIRLNQGAVLPQSSLFDAESTGPDGFGLLAALTSSPVTAYEPDAGGMNAPSLYTDTGSVLQQTPQLLDTLFA